MAALKTCKVAGCCRNVRSRGMCDSHYTMWRRVFVVEVGPLKPLCMTAEILAVLPAMIEDAATRSGTCYETARIAIKQAKAEGKVYICGWNSPAETHGGQRWVPIYERGSKPDAVVSAAEKRAHALARRRSLHIIVKARRAPNNWLGPLMGAA